MEATEGFWAKVDKTETCWLWKRALNYAGYGAVRWNRKVVGAHRVAYELLVGPIPHGLVLDHLCRVRNCVNPEHLDPVTNRENQRRGKHGVLKTHCVNGHEFTPENIYIQPKAGTRSCRVCYEIRGWKRKP